MEARDFLRVSLQPVWGTGGAWKVDQAQKEMGIIVIQHFSGLPPPRFWHQNESFAASVGER